MVQKIDVNDGDTVGLVKAEYDPDDFEAMEGVDPELLIEFAERCQDMGWEFITLAVKRDDEFPILAFERRENHGIYVGLAPVVPDEEGDDGDD